MIKSRLLVQCVIHNASYWLQRVGQAFSLRTRFPAGPAASKGVCGQNWPPHAGRGTTLASLAFAAVPLLSCALLPAQTRVSLTELDQRLGTLENRKNAHQIATKHWHTADTSPLNTFSIGRNIQHIAFDGTNLWVSAANSLNMFQVSPATGAVLASPPVDFTFGLTVADVYWDGHYIWVANPRGDVRRVQPQGFLTAFAGLSNPCCSAFDGAHLWIADSGTATVSVFNITRPFAKVASYSAGAAPSAILFDGNSIWVASNLAGTVSKLRPSDGKILGTYTVGANPREMAFDGRYVWVVNQGSNNVTALKASDGSLFGTFPVGTSPLGIVFDGSQIWVTNQASNNVTVLRASDGSLVGTYPVGTSPMGIAFDGVNIWVVNSGDGTLTKL